MNAPAVFCYPGDIDTPTGGYRYDRRILQGCAGFRALSLPGAYPFPDAAAIAAAGRALAAIPDRTVVVVDGLALGVLPQVVARERERLALVALVHHPLHLETGLDDAAREWLAAAERQALASVRRVVVTSAHTVGDVVALGVASERIVVIEPGTDRPVLRGHELEVVPDPEADPEAADAPLRLLCVASVVPRKGYTTLLDALARVDRDGAARRWRLRCVGSLTRDAAHAQAVLAKARAFGASIEFVGERDEATLAACYERADAFVLASHHEGFGMALAEAIAHGLPIVATRAGAIPATVGDGEPDCPALLVAPGDAEALAAALGRLMREPGERRRLARAAVSRRATLPTWQRACERFDGLVAGLASPEADALAFDADWLALREPFDRDARRRAGLERMLDATAFAAAPRRTGGVDGLDLGGGTGAFLRFLIPALGGEQRWQLVDRDPRLLDAATAAFEPWSRAASARLEPVPHGVRVHAHAFDATVTMRALDLRDPRLLRDVGAVSVVAASALLDLVSLDWLGSLVAAASRGDALLVFSLNYDGRIEWTPSLPADDAVVRAVNADQRADKGFGPALGPDCATTVPAVLARAGYRCQVARSDWVIDTGDTPMQVRLIDDFATIARRQPAACGLEPDAIDDWRRVRREAALGERSTLRIGHVEIVARRDG
ncbi:MAG: glycosyltransferase [Lautropia sp.]